MLKLDKKFFLKTENLRAFFLFTSFFVNVFPLKEIAIAGICLIFLWLGILSPRIVFKKNFLNKIKYSKLALTFILSSLFTTIIRFHDNFFWNLLMVYYHFFCFFILCGESFEKDIDEIKIEAFRIFKFFAYVPTFLALLGIILATVFNSVQIFEKTLGMYKGRLTGVYLNSNTFAFSSTISIISSFMIYKYNKKDSKKFPFKIYFIPFSFIVNFVSIVLSDSRASMLFILIYFVSFQFCLLIKESKNNKLKFVLLLAISLLAVCAIFSMTGIIQNLFKQTIKLFQRKKNVEVGRGNFEITSGRITLFIQGIKLFFHFPIFGTGISNIKEYTSKFLNDKLLYDDLHNAYLTVLVSWGTIGFIVVMSFLILVALYILKVLFNSRSNASNVGYYNFFSLLVSYLVYNFFDIGLLSLIDFKCIFFWIVLGWAMCYANRLDFASKKEEKTNG